MVDLIPPHRRDAAMVVIRALGPERPSITDEGYLVDVEGNERWQQWTTTAVIEHGRVQEIQAVGIDITERKRAEKVLESERARFAALVEYSSDLVLVVEADGTVAYASPSVTRLLGWEGDTIANVLEVLEPATADEALRLLTLRGSADEPFRVVVRVRTAAGGWRWLEVVGTDRTDDPAVGGFVLNGRDVTDERTARDALAERAELLELLSRVSSRFIDVAPAEVDRAIDAALADLGATLDVDRAYVFAASDVGEEVSNTHEWCREGITSFLAALARVPVAAFPMWAAEMRANAPVRITDVGHLDEEWAGERALLEAEGVRSLLAVPMIDDGHLVGFIGLDAVRAPRDWTDLEMAVLGSAAVALTQLLARVAAERAVRGSEARYRALVAGVPDLLVRLDPAGTILDWRASDDVDLGARADPLGCPLAEVVPELAAAVVAAGARAHGEGDATTVVAVEPASGGGRAYEARITPAGDEAILVVRDVTEQRQLQRSLVHAATHDTLTGLANRRLFTERLEEALHRRRRDDTSAPAVLYVDLDGFKVLNDSLGHDSGDRLLVALAQRLAASVRPGDVVARLGGDEFAVLCHRMRSEDEALSTAERILGAVARPFGADGEEHLVTASIGVVLAAEDSSAGALMRDADAAMYRAKARGRRRVEMFTPEIHAAAIERHRIEHDLRRALERDELRIHLQPVWSLRERRWVSAEALVRWQHPERGLLSPGSFLDVADETGVLPELGGWVIGEACRVAAAWRDEGSSASGLVVWVNLAAAQLADPSLADRVLDRLARSGLPPSAFGVEVTETAVVGDVTAARATCAALRDAGIRVALDDFGTGSSSLTQLDQLPLDVVKLDGSFIATIATQRRAHDLVAGIVSLVHTLGIEVIAEGVETASQLAALDGLGVDGVQGYLLARPTPADLIAAVVAEPPSDDAVGAVPRLPGIRP
jgi:diguanylate cyclase (GGDEF)-like protein/PAS domain S-box-containing protein